MDSKTFFDNFETIANAPGGVARLRELILTFAMKGSFSTANDNEEWTDATFNSVGKWIGGNGFPTEEQGKSGGEILFCKVSDMNLEGNEKFIFQTVNTLTREEAKRLKVTVHESGSVIFPKIGGAIATNKRRLLVRPTAIDNNCMGVQPSRSIDSEWLYLLLKSIDFTKYQSGTSLPSLSQKILNQITFRVPSLAEQKRIVVKVEELLELCNELEDAINQRDLIRVDARMSTIDSISIATTPEELNAAWKRISSNWTTIADTPESVSSLRSLILDLAVRGKLIERLNEADWETEIQLHEVGKMIRGVTYAKAESSKSEKLGMVPLLGASNIQRNINFDGLTYVPERLIKPNQIVSDGDVLICMSSGSKHLVGKTGSISLPPRASFGAFCAVFRISDRANHEYIAMFFKSPVYRKAISTASRGIGINNLRIGDVESIAFFLPALSEQKRIVCKVDELMALCDQLEHFLLERSELSKKIAGALVAEVAA